ncbi:MAG: M55 family metallopeptidase [Sphingomonadales bacterium]|jgi:D-amino peptidase
MKFIITLLVVFCFGVNANSTEKLKIFISVDMEGIGGVGSPEMTSRIGKDYALGRELMTKEVNTVVAAIFLQGEAEILINDSHGDHQNLHHTKLDPRVSYIQGHRKLLGMVEGLDDSFDGAIFIGFHARAGTEGGFLAHTGSNDVKGLWLNGIEVGEGGLNAAFAGSLGVPVLMASGDKKFAEEFKARTNIMTVVTKEALTANAAKLVHPKVVRGRLSKGVKDALENISKASTFSIAKTEVNVRLKVATTIRADVLMSVPNMKRVDGFTVEYDAKNMDEAYKLIRMMYKFIVP